MKKALSCASVRKRFLEEALQAQSRPDFIAKLSISHKESFETRFWLRLIVDGGLSTAKETSAAWGLLQEVMALLTAIPKTTKAHKKHQ